MDFNFTEEQISLQDTLNRFIAKDYSFEDRRKRIASGDTFSEQTWNTLAELGILALPFPEELGGLNGTALDNYLVMKALAPGLLLEPYVSTVILAGTLLQEAGTPEQKSAYIEEIAAGGARYSFAHYEPNGRYQETFVSTTAQKDGNQWILNGHKAAALDVQHADYIIVSARTSGAHTDSEGISLFRLPKDTAGVTIKQYRTHDGHNAADIIFSNTAVAADTLIGQEGQAANAIGHALAITNAALTAEASGLIDALNKATLEYLKVRKQFGVPIGSFQALQHRMAEMLIAAEQANSMALLAATEMSNTDLKHRQIKSSGAKAYVGKLARQVAQEAVQMHGGIGVTDELNVAHFYKRIALINMIFGDVDYHFDRYSNSLLS